MMQKNLYYNQSEFIPFLEPNLMDNFDLLIFYACDILWETRLIKTNKYITNYIKKTQNKVDILFMYP